MFTRPFASEPGEQSYTIKSFSENLNVVVKDSLDARVAQAGTKLMFAVESCLKATTAARAA